MLPECEISCHSIDNPCFVESSSNCAHSVRTTSRRCSGSPQIPSSGGERPERNRYQEATFRGFFEEALTSGGALVALDRANGHIIGSSRYHGYDAQRSVIEIGWSFLARAYWGGRYNGEMKQVLVEHAFRSVKRVIFIIGPENRRSQRAVEKIGGMRAGVTIDAHGRNGWYMSSRWSFLRAGKEWAPLTSG